MSNSQKMPNDFPPATIDDWWQAADKALKGASRNRLVGKTEDGIDISPIYEARRDAISRSMRLPGQDWLISQRIDISDVDKANAQILDDLSGGVNSLTLAIDSAGLAYGSGINIDNVGSFERLFKDVQLDLIDMQFEAGEHSLEVLAVFLSYLKAKNIDPKTLSFAAKIDPFAVAAECNFTRSSLQTLLLDTKDAVRHLEQSVGPISILGAQGRLWHDAGATTAQELAFVLATATAQLRLLEESGADLGSWGDWISVGLVADADQIGTIAKARAIRSLWSRVIDCAGLPQSCLRLDMVTSYRMLTALDPWVNLLRNTVATFGAGIGGANSITVLPHSLASEVPDSFARRLTRNLQSILLEESNLAKVSDPAAGSGAIEDRTEKLCSVAWELFQKIEASGGMGEALYEGLIQDQIESSREKLQKSVALRKRPITGVSEFPNLKESVDRQTSVDREHSEVRAPSKLDLQSPNGGKRFAALLEQADDGKSINQLSRDWDVLDDPSSFQPLRLSQPYEHLRGLSDQFAARSGEMPKVFLATLGSLSQYNARATWVANAFAAGGFEAVGAQQHENLEALVTSFKSSGSRIVCLVSSDQIYEDAGTEAIRALKDARAETVYLAGNLKEQEQVFRDAGVDGFVFAGCDLVSFLTQAQTALRQGDDELSTSGIGAK